MWVVCNEYGEAPFKQLKKYGKIRILYPLNPKYDTIELRKDVEYRIVGVVLEKKKVSIKYCSTGSVNQKNRFRFILEDLRNLSHRGGIPQLSAGRSTRFLIGFLK